MGRDGDEGDPTRQMATSLLQGHLDLAKSIEALVTGIEALFTGTEGKAHAMVEGWAKDLVARSVREAKASVWRRLRAELEEETLEVPAEAAEAAAPSTSTAPAEPAPMVETIVARGAENDVPAWRIFLTRLADRAKPVPKKDVEQAIISSGLTVWAYKKSRTILKSRGLIADTGTCWEITAAGRRELESPTPTTDVDPRRTKGEGDVTGDE